MIRFGDIQGKYGTKFRFLNGVNIGREQTYMVVDQSYLFGGFLAIVDLKYGLLSSYSAIDSILERDIVILEVSPL